MLNERQVNRHVESIIAQVSDIAAMPQVVYKIIELTGSTMTAAQQIEDAIAVDPGFTSKVLMLANSAHYALPRRVTSIRDAATYMGYKTIRQLALTVGLFDMFVGKTDAGSMRRRSWWRHSVDAAVCARAIAKRMPDVGPDDAYSCGLLHDAGKSLLDRYAEGEYSAVDKMIEEGTNPLEAERAVFGCDHSEVGGVAAEMWNFSPMLVECVTLHHSEAGSSYPKHVALTCLASEMAHAVLAGRRAEHMMSGARTEEGEQGRNHSPWAVETLGFDVTVLWQLYTECTEAIARGGSLGL